MRIKNSSFKNQIPRTPYFIAQTDQRKNIKVMRLLGVRCAPLTGIAKEILLAHNNIRLLVRHGDHHWYR